MRTWTGSYVLMRSWLPVVLVLWLGTAAVAAAAPRVGPGAAGRTQLSRPKHATVSTGTIVPTVADVITAEDCPGIQANGTSCGTACQLRLCRALATFFKTSNNLTDPWDNEEGWELTSTMSCDTLVNASPRRAVYCSWFGITCCSPELIAEERCSAVNSVLKLELPINNINASVENPGLLSSLKTLHGCGMRVLNLEANNLIGALSDEWGDLDRLIVFTMGNSWLSGTIPDGLSRMRNITLINLSNNWINGTLPTWLPELTELRVLNLGSNAGGNTASSSSSGGGDSSEEPVGLLGTIPAGLGNLRQLRELNLEANSLTGMLPKDICNGDNSSLLLLNVRGNKLEGNAKGVETCGNLVQLDISQNRFSGSLPASIDWDELATYRAGSNMFSGRFPLKLTAARILEHFDISNNRLTGGIPSQITLLSSLKTFVVSSNKFNGTVNENIYYLPALAKLDLSNNTLVGTTAQSIGLAYGLAEMDISNNPGLTGVMPPQMGLLARLKQVRATNTSISCAGIIRPYVIATNNSCSDPDRCTTPVTYGDPETRYQRCSEDQLLPCFLRFSEYMIPRDDQSNMRCKYILRRPADEAQQHCASLLGAQAQQLPDLGGDRLQQMWHVDPSYFQYQVCECLLGYKPVWLGNGTVMECHHAGTQTPTAIIVGVVAAAAVLIIGLLAWWQYLTTRPRWLRERILQAKRSRGAPKASKPGDKVTVSIVVTDVKDFSDLTRQYPELMNKAMGIHNNILRKASHNHAGYIMDQEGDSWTLAFHDAEDAVAFSLQVQQALAQRSWGKLRGAHSQHDFSDLAIMRDGVFSARFSHTHQSSMTSTAVRHSSSSFGLMGEELSEHGATTLAVDSFTGGHQGSSTPSKVNASFSSSVGRGSSAADRSFTVGRRAVSEELPAGNNPAVAPVPANLPNGLGKAGAGPALGAAGSGVGGTAAAAPPVSDQKVASGSSQHQPDHRQVSFSDAVPGRDANSPSSKAVQHPQQQQLLRLLRCNSDEEMVQPSGNSGNSWPDDIAAASPANATMNKSFQSYARGSDMGMGSLSITAASRGRSSGSGSRLWSAGAAVMRRFSVFSRSGMLSSSTMAAGDIAPQHALQLSVRIGIATGRLPCGCDLNNCAVKDKAKNYVSEVANGGQILLDEVTFKAIKDSLSVLGTVNGAGYDDRQLQQLLHSRLVNRLQHHILCGTCACSGCSTGLREASFSSAAQLPDIQDYDNDALVVHMGAFEPPAGPQNQPHTHSKHVAAEGLGATSDSSPPSTPSAAADEHDAVHPLRSKDTADAGAELVGAVDLVKHKAAARGSGARKQKVVHLYAVAAPGMRRVPTSTRDMMQCLSWAAPVELKRQWAQVQKGYFDAPGARSIDLAPAAQGGDQAALPEVVIVFAQVVGSLNFSYRRRSETHTVRKAITRCMLQMLDELPETEEGRDGYLCRIQEADLKYMVSFKAAHTALQWCMMVQEALMYFSWPDSILSQPGFEDVLDPITGLPVFRGPRLRIGFAVGQPNSVLPDHAGRANYYGHSVNRAARFMEAAAHGGQIVTDVSTARQLFAVWHREDSGQCGAGLDRIPSRAHSDADVQPMLDAQTGLDVSSDAALLQMLTSRSQSETTGHCRPSAARTPLSRLAQRQQQQQTGWMQQQLQQGQQLQARDRQPQLQGQGSWGQSFSSPLPDSFTRQHQQHLQQQAVVQPPNGPSSGRQQQLQPLNISVEPSQASFLRRQQQLAAGNAALGRPQVSASGGSFTRPQVAASGGSLTRQQVSASGGSFTRQQVLASGVSFTRQQVAASGGSFTRRQQLAAGAGGVQQGTSMGASFSTHRNAASSGGAAAGHTTVVQSGQSFSLQVPLDWQHNPEAGEVCESVSVTHLGTFSFKGSGVYDMVSILPGSLVGRQFPEEAPKGKGHRVMVAEGPVAGIEPVTFSLPPRLVAARLAFKARQASGCDTAGSS